MIEPNCRLSQLAKDSPMRWLFQFSSVLAGFVALCPAAEPNGPDVGGIAGVASESTDIQQPEQNASATADTATNDADRNDTDSGKRQDRDLPRKWQKNFRGSGDQTPPRIDRIGPSPGARVVDNLGVSQVRIGFTEAVTIPAGSITAWTVGTGTVSGFSTSFDTMSNELTVAFATPIRDDRLTIVLDYAISDLAGNELDGEIGDPANPTLPSGDGIRGGQAVFRFNILQGDANRDGVSNSTDATIIRDLLGLCVDEPGFDPHADLNVDGCINALDVAIFSLASGRSLPATDGVVPIVAELTNPSIELMQAVNTIRITFNERIAGERINERTCFVVDGTENIIVPVFGVQSGTGFTAVYTFVPPLPQCDTYTVNISNALADLSGELLVPPSTPPILTGLVPPPAPVLNPHTTSTMAASVTVTGTAPGASTVEVTHVLGNVFVPVTNNSFSANVPLADNRINPIFYTARSTCDNLRSPPRRADITRDNEDPNLYIDFPADGSSITTNATDVAGRVGDILSGYLGLTVTVNGMSATVNEGIGNNGTFFAPSVPLNPSQPNTLTVTATDQRGNFTTKQIMVTQAPVPANTPKMVIVGGNAQAGPIASLLADPIDIRMTKHDSTPFVNKVVTFKVSRSNGRLYTALPPLGEGKMMVQVHTDATGLARAYLRLGTDAGFGNNRVTVTSQSIAGTVVFCASATAGAVKQINIGSGNNQKAEAGGPAPEPLRVWVSDGCNGIPAQLIEFTVIRGGGKVRAAGTSLDLDSVTVQTGDTGHAAVYFTLGPNQGSNAIEARLVNYPNLQPARFLIYGLVRDPTQPTTFTGIVLNNAGQPIQNVQCVLMVGTATPVFAYTDINGRFRFDNVSSAGDADLYIIGSTATHVGGPMCTQPSCNVPMNTFPFLHFEMVVVPNSENSLPMPIMLPPLNPNNVTTTYSATPGDPDAILTVEGMDGLEMRVKAGSMRLADGESAPNGQPIYLNQVHEDAIPMPIPDGASPPFTWTLQPAGATFDPPIEIKYPNMSGLQAGSIAYFLSFNHDTSRFEIIASGHVTDDGAYIMTDPGSGLSLAGWGCNCPPYSVTGECCTGCEVECCDGVCCNCACCEGKCCNGRCCTDCCGGQCCSGECCNGQCCSGGKKCCEGKCCKDCCDGRCCDTVCCEGICCPEGTKSCCDGRCCPSACCEEIGLCCPPGSKSCCGGKCCPGPCCEEIELCCGAQYTSCCNNQCCLGECCEDGFGGEECCNAGQTCCDQECCPGGCCSEECCPGIPCCDENGYCCETQCCGENNDQCCEPGGECCLGQNCCAANAHCCFNSILGHCCPNGEACCGPNNCCDAEEFCADQGTGLCCDLGVVACGLFGGPKHCCDPGQECCNNGQCCDFPCDQCLDNGTLSGGMIEVNPDPACVGQTVTFTASGVMDSGGLKRINCNPTELDPVEPTYTWVITRPVGSPITGSGSTASVVTTVVGSYCVTFTARADRECSPAPRMIGPFCTMVRNVNLIFDGLPEATEENPGGLICVNNDDDNLSVRADKDDDPGGILGENDLKTLELTLNGVTDEGMGTLDIIQGAGGTVWVYFNANRSGLVALPFLFDGTDLPITLYVEGFTASLNARDVTAEMVYTLPEGGVCKDKVKVSVGDVEFKGYGQNPEANEFTGNVHRNIDLVQMTYAHPVVTIDPNIFISSLVPEPVEIRGDITTFTRPLSSGDVTANGLIASLTTDSMSPPEGPFLQHFSRTVTLDDYDLLVKVAVKDAAGSFGWDKLITVANLNEVNGTMNSRSSFGEASTPRTGFQDPPFDFPFRIEVRDPYRTIGTVSATVDTGVGTPRTIQLTGSGGVFLSTFLRIVPENTNLGGTSQTVLNTRFPAKLGGKIMVRYTLSDGSMCEDTAIVTGAMFVRADDQTPLESIQAGLARHVVHGVSARNILAVVGAPGDLQNLPIDGGIPYVNGSLTVNTFQDQPSPVITTAVTDNLLRVDQLPTQPNYNLFRTKTTKPLLPLASDASMWTALTDRTYFNVEAGGFLRLSVATGVGTFKAVKLVRGESIVNILVDGLGAGFPREFFPNPQPDNMQTLMAAGLLPNFKSLITDAAGSRIRWDGHTTFPSITYSAWSSWVTGNDPKDHGVTGSNFYRRNTPSSDPFWCAQHSDPNCDLGLTGPGMLPPIDMVIFLDPRDGIFDLDVANVWSEIGTLNSAIRPRTMDSTSISTLYERLAATGLISSVVYHFPFRGIEDEYRGLPTAWQGHEQHSDSSGWGLDRGTVMELEEIMGQDAQSHVRPPQVITVYYAGLDTNIHNNSGYPNGPIGVDHLIRTDRALSKVVRILDQWNLMDDAIFSFTGDHGLSRVANDDDHSLVLEETLDEELEEIMEAAGFEPLDVASETSHNAVLAINGGMAHIYVKNRLINSWSALPRYLQDVRVMAERLYDNNIGALNDDEENNNVGAFDLILVRNPAGGFGGPYEVLVKQGGSFSTMTLTQAIANGMVDPSYINFEANIQRLQDVRSGDVILLAEGICQNDATGFYFGAPLPGWHGSLCASDMTIPIVFSFPRGSGPALMRFLSILDTSFPQPPSEVRITNIEPTINELLTLEVP